MRNDLPATGLVVASSKTESPTSPSPVPNQQQPEEVLNKF